MAIDKDTLWVTGAGWVNDGADVMVIVAYCPRCAAPVYAANYFIGEGPPPVQHTCECRDRLWAWFRQPLSDETPITEGTGQPPWAGDPSYSGTWRNVPLARGYSPQEIDEIHHPEKYGRPTKPQQVGTQPDSTADTVV